MGYHTIRFAPQHGKLFNSSSLRPNSWGHPTVFRPLAYHPIHTKIVHEESVDDTFYYIDFSDKKEQHFNFDFAPTG